MSAKTAKEVQEALSWLLFDRTPHAWARVRPVVTRRFAAR